MKNYNSSITIPFGLVPLTIGLSALAALPAAGQSLQALSDYSVITRGNFTTNSDVEGRTVVGGDFLGTNSSTLANRLQNSVTSSDFTFQVAGNISTGNPINLEAGSLEYGGSLNGRKINFNGGGSAIQNVGVDYFPIFDTLTQASSDLASLTANNSLDIPSKSAGPLNFDPVFNGAGQAIYEVSGNLVFSNNQVQQIGLRGSQGGDILINVTGTDITFNQGNFVDGFTQEFGRANVIWNFYEATSLTFERQFSGQILAPLATLTTNQNIDGSVFVNELITTSEVHLPSYGGDNFNAVPEPSTLGFLLLPAFGLLRRKR